MAPGAVADLILFPDARRLSELLSRPQLDRIVLRKGIVQESTLPAYEELDDLVSVPSRSCMITCFGPSQSITPHLVGTIQLRLGPLRLARLALEAASMVVSLKKSGGTPSDESRVPCWCVSSTVAVPHSELYRKKDVRITRVSAWSVGYEPTARSEPQMPTRCSPPRVPQTLGVIASSSDCEIGSVIARMKPQRALP